jgi:hypothetical protein
MAAWLLAGATRLDTVRPRPSLWNTRTYLNEHGHWSKFCSYWWDIRFGFEVMHLYACGLYELTHWTRLIMWTPEERKTLLHPLRPSHDQRRTGRAGPKRSALTETGLRPLRATNLGTQRPISQIKDGLNILDYEFLSRSLRWLTPYPRAILYGLFWSIHLKIVESSFDRSVHRFFVLPLFSSPITMIRNYNIHSPITDEFG